jgi:CelD/BcsL family acetyltransferase involved in cellulose biosynthesis
VNIRLSIPRDPEALGTAWRDLEQRADGSFFQGWTWTGCLFRERFPDPVLVEAAAEGRIIALALFNRRRSTLVLGATGSSEYDTTFIEHNGVLVEKGWPSAVVAGILAKALQAARRGLMPGTLLLEGIDAQILTAANEAGGFGEIRQTRIAPWVDLVRILRSGQESLAHVSANTRYQIRRSERSYAARGPLQLIRATSSGEAHRFLDALARLHQAYWKARGKPGSFAIPVFSRFHHELIDRGFLKGEVDLLRTNAGDQVIGYLYNFRYRGRVSAYQSGFVYGEATRHEKPGLTCHHQAIETYLAQRLLAYDFLGGADRYKRSLANAQSTLHWATLHATWSPCRLLAPARASSRVFARWVCAPWS